MSFERKSKMSMGKEIMENAMARFFTKPCLSDNFSGQKLRQIYKLLNISSEDDQNVKILDQDKTLILVHFLNPTESTKHIRGAIVDTAGDHPQIVCASFPHTYDRELEDKEVEKFVFSKENTLVSNAYEGTILRLFYSHVHEAWVMSTHKKINGYSSKWAAECFGETFDRLWGDENYYNNLDDKCCYIFLLSDPKNRLVCEIPKETLYLVGVYRQNPDGTMTRIHPLPDIGNPNIKTTQYLPVHSHEELKSAVQELSFKNTTGILLCNLDNPTEALKIMAPGYNSLRQVRGGEPNLKLRYLEVKLQGKSEDIRALYPEHKQIFDTVETCYTKLPHHLSLYYEKRYVRGEYLRVPQEEFTIISRTHDSFDKNLNVVDNIRRELNSSTARQLNAMIKNMSTYT